jgi:hypothetical protein
VPCQFDRSGVRNHFGQAMDLDVSGVEGPVTGG